MIASVTPNMCLVPHPPIDKTGFPTDSKPVARGASFVVRRKKTTQARERHRDPTPDSGSRPPPYLKPKGSRHARNASSQGTGLQFAGFRGHQYRSQ
jgi:hypothetical protein